MQSFKKIGIELYEKLCLHTVYILRAKIHNDRYKTVREVVLTTSTHCPYTESEKLRSQEVPSLYKMRVKND